MKLGSSRRDYGKLNQKAKDDDVELEDEFYEDDEDAPKDGSALHNQYSYQQQPVRADERIEMPARLEECSSVIGKESTWEGNFSTEESVRLDGHITGKIKAAGTVHITEGAQVNADVIGKFVVIAGSYDGKLICSERLQLLPSSKIRGSITTKIISVGDGAFIDGEIHMTDEAHEVSSPLSMFRKDEDDSAKNGASEKDDSKAKSTKVS
jgi:cytoskeletal protein CcmA (bactofilin family)